MFSESVIAFVNLINVTLIVKVLNLHNRIYIIEEVVPTFSIQGPINNSFEMGKQNFCYFMFLGYLVKWDE